MNLEQKLSQYPKTKPPKWCFAHNRPFVKACHGCKAVFAKQDRVCFIETQVNFFRGDDEVECLCAKCAVARGIQHPDVAQLRQLRNELAAAERKHANQKINIAKLKERIAAMEFDSQC